MARKPLFTVEDAKTSSNLFCLVYGIITLGMPDNFSCAGPVIAIFAMAFMAFANVYAICRVMLLAPTSVKTYGDLGEWVMGKPGRYLSSQRYRADGQPPIGLVRVPRARHHSRRRPLPRRLQSHTTTWSILMAVTCLPVCLVPTLKRRSRRGLCRVCGYADHRRDRCRAGGVRHARPPEHSKPRPQLQTSRRAFGNLSLANGAGLVVPALQRQCSDPTRMPRIVGATIAFTSICFLMLAVSVYTSVGCQISGNILWAIYPDSVTGLTTLDFAPDWGLVVLAYLCMQVHITIAFSVILNPAFYIRSATKHKAQASDVESNLQTYAEVSKT